MKIREGAYYRTRGGQVFGPMVRDEDYNATYIWRLSHAVDGTSWAENGRWHLNEEYPFDLVAEVYVSDTPPDRKRETEAELREMMRDPRYWRTREPEYVKRVTEGFRTLVGGDTPPADTPSFIHPALDGPSGPFLIMPETKTLRDEFAMRLMDRDAFMVGYKEEAAQLYRAADAMMEARKK
jgi:hypothetical protein